MTAGQSASQANLVRYDAARKALAEAHRVDEVKDLRDKAIAMSAYAKQAKDTAMIEMATEIKVRAERRLGEMLRDMPKNGGNQGQGRPSLGGSAKAPPKLSAPSSTPPKARVPEPLAPKLEQLGIDKKLSARAQKLAAIPEADFETTVATAKHVVGEVTSAFVLKAASPSKPRDSREADENTPVVITPEKPKAEWERAQDVMYAIQRLGDPKIAVDRVWAAILPVQHYRIHNAIDSAIAYLQSIKDGAPTCR